ncbi:membrane protein of ER body-like protein [Primulina huaijiensis]|uniref:membrane protein of ER body-like protein n=1 Tax=Primulina huaijiensis TaxID=1492673 RepID=UPI003CC75D56
MGNKEQRLEHYKVLKFETEGVGHGQMEVSSQSHKASEEIESADIDLINKERKYDVKTVLQKQNTHDLYCPDCNSCITGRVILRKRKRNKIQIPVKPSKPEKQSAQVSGCQVHLDHINICVEGAQERTEDVRRNSKIEVIKSIVYGGLAELITSLSVVSSAAGGDATTLNILALGMANLIGGFFVICHNLWELRCEQTDQVNSQSDRYQELLGQRQNFKLHAIVCVLSYFIFGLTPIVVYGFSFRQSEERELKLVVVGAVSLVCIIALSIGKAYVCRPPKAYVKTVVNFVILGFMASGISYAVGVLVKRFLERLGLFQSTSVPDMIFNRDSTWASY